MNDPVAPTQAAQQEPRDSRAPGHSRADTSIAEPLPGARSFLGRDEELAELSSLLERTRLITLTGPPGIGKSRLASELAEALAAGYEGGAALVELASVSDSEHVAPAAAAALSFQETPGEVLTDTLVAGLVNRRTLLVMDNCEHVLQGSSALIEALLTGCPEVSVVATSREPLVLPAETVWQVPPLSLPPSSESDRQGELIDYAAVRLFVERAGAVEPGFSLNDYVAPAVLEICRRLDGLPLAIELAAGRVELLSPQEIARRLEDRLDLLTDPTAAPRLRHQTLEAALDWSYELLSEPERVLLERLSVFAGGFDLEAAASVCAGEDVGPSEVSKLVERLVAKSLLATDLGDARYRLLETIRAYAGERLEQSGEARGVREAHARFYMELAEQAEPELTGPAQQAWFERFEAERANARSALEWVVGHGRGEWALRLTGALVFFWQVRCHFSEGRSMLAAAYAASEGAPVELRAKVRWGEGFLAVMAGDSESAIPLLEESLEDFREVGELRGSGRALLMLGNCKEGSDGLPLVEESVVLARRAGDSWCLASALGVAGLEYCYRDELDAARPLFEECLLVARSAGDKHGLRIGLVGLGLVALRQGDPRSAEPLFEECVAIAEQVGEIYGKGIAMRYLGDAAFVRGDYARARQLLDESITLIRKARPSDLVPALVMRARVARADGRRPDAHRLLEEAMELARTGGHAPAGALQGMGELAAEEGDQTRARRLFEEAVELAQADHDRYGTAHALHGLGQLARVEGETYRATTFLNDALRLRRQIGDPLGITTSLEAVAGLAAGTGGRERAVRVFAAVQRAREQSGYARHPWDQPRFESDLGVARAGLSAEVFERASVEGASFSLEQAVAHVSNGREPADPESNGWSSLTERERKVAHLVAQGLTNPEIARLLFVSLATVKARLSSVFWKLGMSRRSELVRDVARSEQEPPETNS